MSELLDELAEMARHTEPPRLEEDAAAEMIARAVRTSSMRRRRRLATTWALAATILLGVGVGVGTRLHPTTAPMRAALPSGDRIVAEAGSQFDVETVTTDSRVVRVDHGTVLFDVEPLAPGERFEVHTSDGVVRVRGTVFSVQHEDGVTAVRVYEGEVELERSGRRVRLSAGRMASRGRVESLDEGPLHDAGRSAARERETRAAVARREAAAESTDAIAVVEAAEPAVAAEAEVVEPEVVAEADADAVAVAVAEPDAEVGSAAARRITRGRVAGWIAQRDYARALEHASRRGWRMLEGDALRGLERFAEAADAYDAVEPADGRAAFAAARIRNNELGDVDGALRSLERAPEHSALDERVLGLRVRLLHRAGRHDEARSDARRYLESWPDGGLADWMRSVVDSPQ